MTATSGTVEGSLVGGRVYGTEEAQRELKCKHLDGYAEYWDYG